MLSRFLLSRVEEALADTRVVLLLGARQVGKGTLARQVANEQGWQSSALTVRARWLRHATTRRVLSLRLKIGFSSTKFNGSRSFFS